MGRRKKKKKRKKISIRNYRISQNVSITNFFLESLLPESFPSLGVTVHLTFLECLPTLGWSLDLLGGGRAALCGNRRPG